MGLFNLLNAAAYLVLPTRTKLRVYLMEELKLRGIDAEAIPDACLQELADDVVDGVKTLAKMSRTDWRADITNALEGEATIVAYIIEGTAEAHLKGSSSGGLDRRRAVFFRHRVKFVPPEGPETAPAQAQAAGASAGAAPAGGGDLDDDIPF